MARQSWNARWVGWGGGWGTHWPRFPTELTHNVLPGAAYHLPGMGMCTLAVNYKLDKPAWLPPCIPWPKPLSTVQGKLQLDLLITAVTGATYVSDSMG